MFRSLMQSALFVTLLATALFLCACGGSPAPEAARKGPDVQAASELTEGSPLKSPKHVTTHDFNDGAAIVQNEGSIDLSQVDDGVVLAKAKSKNRLKFTVACGQMTYNYDLPGNGTPIVCPLNMGDGSYTFSVMRNTSDKNYVQVTTATQKIKLSTECVPFLYPNLFCDYTDKSACVKKARELTQDAKNVGDALRLVCTYIVNNVEYDSQKAENLGGVTGYVPNPDETFNTNKGICFDYASLGGAMLRSIGIPTKVVTGYVSPKDLYHAWIMVFIDGSWQSVKFSVSPHSWSRVDLTFGTASGNEDLVGDGTSYTDRYIY